MNIVATPKIDEAMRRYPAACDALAGWYQVMTQSEFVSEQSIRATFGDMRGFDSQFRFPIPGTTLLVHALINFETQVLFIEQIKPGNH